MGQTRGPLAGRVAVVAGATRGCGRGIARGLAESGATVYCTGRSTRGNPSPYHRPETIEETAELVTEAGGTGIPVAVDHGDEAQVKALFQRVDREQRRLDILVNSIAGEDPAWKWNEKFWNTDLENLTGMFRQTVLTHLITAKHAAPYMIKRKRGLIVEVTDRDSFGFQGFGFAHDIVKANLMRFGFVMAEELRKTGVSAVAVTPGYLRSEAMLDQYGVTEATWRDGAAKDPHFLESETPLYLGRGVAALAADPELKQWSGDAMSSAELGKRYGVTDYDGRRPDVISYFAQHVMVQTFGLDELRRGLAWQRRTLERAERWLPAEARATAPKEAARRVLRPTRPRKKGTVR
jgi:NAD(P)-dependent dehydrogenase (short-subunit alcohol dehydrogenase family)